MDNQQNGRGTFRFANSDVYKDELDVVLEHTEKLSEQRIANAATYVRALRMRSYMLLLRDSHP